MRTSGSRAARRWPRVAPLLALLALASGAAAVASPAPQDDALRAAVVARFDVLPLRSGLVLRPRGEAQYHAVEFTADGVAVDGETLERKALRERLGEDYGLIERLSHLSDAERRAL